MVLRPHPDISRPGLCPHRGSIELAFGYRFDLAQILASVVLAAIVLRVTTETPPRGTPQVVVATGAGP